MPNNNRIMDCFKTIVRFKIPAEKVIQSVFNRIDIVNAT
jgi:hypothetical protein